MIKRTPIIISFCLILLVCSKAYAEDITINTDTMWRNTTKTYDTISIIGGSSFNLNKSDINIAQKGELRILTDILGNTAQDIGFKFVLDNESVFSHAKDTYKAFTYLKGSVIFDIKNKSSLTLGTIMFDESVSFNDLPAGQAAAEIDLRIQNASATINQIYLYTTDEEGQERYGLIRRILINNDEDGRSTYTSTIINGIYDTSVQRTVAIRSNINNVDIVNGALEIRGDIISGSSFGINAKNGLLRMRSIDISGISNIVATDNSNIDMLGSRLRVSGEFVVGARSTASMGVMAVTSPLYVVTADASTIKIENIYFNDNENAESSAQPQGLKFTAANTSTLELTKINMSWASEWGPNSYLWFIGDATANKLTIGQIDIDNSDLELSFDQIDATINYLNYDTHTAQIIGLNGQRSITINNDLFLYASGQAATMSLDNVNLDVKGGLKFANTNNVTLNLENSKNKVNSFYCQGICNDLTITGNEKSASSIEVVDFDSRTSAGNTGSFTLNNVNFKSTTSFYWNGIFSATNSDVSLIGATGTFNGITLDNSNLSIEKDSSITMTDDISVGSGGSLSINAENIFVNPSDVTINNSGALNINQTNNVGTISNVGTVIIKGKSHINSLTNTGGSVSLYDTASLANLASINGYLNIYGENRVDTLDIQGEKSQNIIYVELSKLTGYANLTIGEIKDGALLSDLSNVNIRITSPSILRPGRQNKFTFLTLENGQISDDIDIWLRDSLSVLPSWLIGDRGVDVTENGQSAWIDIQRLTDFRSLVCAANGNDLIKNEDDSISCGGSVADKGTLTVATTIDTVVFSDIVQAEGALHNIVNSLDYNSGCGVIDEELLYAIHNGNPDRIKEVPCLYGMVNNLSLLKPINNEIFLVHTLNNNTNIFDRIIEENRVYNGVGDSYVWVSNTVMGSFIQSKNYVTGYNSFSNNIQGGVTGSPWGGINTTLSGGVTVGIIDGKNRIYDSILIGANGAVGGTYLTPYLYTSVTGLYSLDIYDNKRYTNFLNNDYSNNRGTINRSRTIVNTLAIKAEVGTEYHLSRLVYDDVYIVPKLNATISNVMIGNSNESGTAASLNQKNVNVFVVEVGGGLDFYKEFLMQYFLWQHNSFWKPQVSLSTFYRAYTVPKTQAYFNGDNGIYSGHVMVFDGADYSGIIVQPKVALEYQKDSIEAGAGYILDYGMGSYYNHRVFANIKYNF